MFVHAHGWSWGRITRLVAPGQVMQGRADQPFVFVLDGTHARRQDVKLGRRLSDQVEIPSRSYGQGRFPHRPGRRRSSPTGTRCEGRRHPIELEHLGLVHPTPVQASIILFAILTILGLGSFMLLGIDETPNIDDPIVNVSVAEIGAAPSELETQVTRRVEDAVSGSRPHRSLAISSSVTEGFSSTTIEFELGTDTDRAVNDVRDAITRIRSQLPGRYDQRRPGSCSGSTLWAGSSPSTP